MRFGSNEVEGNILSQREEAPESGDKASDLTHEEMRSSVLGNLRALPSPTETFESLKAAIEGCNPVSVLARLTNRFLFIRRDEFQEESAEVNLHHRYIEFLTGLIVSRPFPSGDLEELTAAQCDVIWERLKDYYLAVNRDLMADRLKKDDPLHSLAFDARNYSLSVRGEAYPHQLEQMATSLYGEHDDWFERTLGFTIRQALDTFHAIGVLSAWRRHQVRESTPDPAVQMKMLDQYAEEIIGFTVNDLEAASTVPRVACESLLKRLSQDFGYRNSEYPDTFLDAKEAPWDFNTLYEKPFVHQGGKYFMFVPPLVRTALFKTFRFDLHADKAYRETFKAAQGRWLEQQVADRMRRVFGPDAVILNAKKANKGREELSDVLVLYDRNILIVQCKSKGLRQDSRVGADYEALIGDVRKAVVDAFDQGIAARDYLLATEEPLLLVENRELRISQEFTTAIYLLTVTPVPLQFLTTRLANNPDVRGLFAGNEFPWALSLPDLDTITEVLNTPARFLHYARQHSGIEHSPMSLHGDEMDLLGLYLSGHLVAGEAQFEGYDGLMIAGISGVVDEFVWNRYEQGLPVDPPQPPMSPKFGELLDKVLSSRCFGATDCAIALLNLSGNARKQLVDKIEEVKEKAKKTGKMQRLTMILEEGQVGLSFLALESSPGDAENLARQLELSAIVQKYAERCPTWVAMAADASSERCVDLCMFLKGPWEADAGLEKLADKFFPIRARNRER